MVSVLGEPQMGKEGSIQHYQQDIYREVKLDGFY